MRLGIALLVTAATAIPAAAQTALGTGNELDANLRIGSGGVNNRVPNTLQQRLQYNNAIVTGNVPFGRQFRFEDDDEIPYLDTRDFRGLLGSNDLFGFQRESATSRLFTSGVRGTDALDYQIGLTTGSIAPRLLSFSPTGTIDRSGAQPTREVITGSIRSTGSYLATQSIRPTLLTYASNDDTGESYVVTASPLTGVRRLPVANETSILADEFAEEQSQDLDGFGRLRGMITGLEPSVTGVQNVLSASTLVEQAAISDRIETESPVYDSIVEDISNSVGQTPASEDGVGVTGDLLEGLRSLLRGDSPTLLEEAKPPLDTGTPEAPEVPNPLDPIDPDKAALEQMWLDLDPALAGMDPDLLRALRESRTEVEELAAGGRASVASSAYLRHMESGQQLLTEGRYFDAEDRFIRAMSAKPGDVMALVGRAHAQLGGGLFLSAGANIRRLLSEKPELVTAIYDADLLPTRARLERLNEQLTEIIDSQTSGLRRDAPLLLAYIARQTGDQETLRYALDELDAVTDSDDGGGRSLVALLRATWLPNPSQK